MKKLFALILALVMLLPLCACSSGLATEETGEKASYSSLILRNITYVIASIEGIVVLLNNGKRLGDSFAKTQVVRKTK